MKAMIKNSQQGFCFNPLIISGNECTASLFIPFKHLIVDIPFPHVPNVDRDLDFIPREELDHFLRVREPITYAQMYEYLDKTKKNDFSEGYETIKAWSHVVEGCSLAYEEINSEYKGSMDRYRRKLVNWLKIPRRKINTPKEQLNIKNEIMKAFKNLRTLYSGKESPEWTFNKLVQNGLCLSGPSGFVDSMRNMSQVSDKWREDNDLIPYLKPLVEDKWSKGDRPTIPDLLESKMLSPFAMNPKHFIYRACEALFSVLYYPELQDLPKAIDMIFLATVFSGLELPFFNLLLLLPIRKQGKLSMFKKALHAIPSADWFKEWNKLSEDQEERGCQIEQALDKSHKHLEEVVQQCKGAVHYAGFLVFDWKQLDSLKTYLTCFVSEFKEIAKVAEKIFQEGKTKCAHCSRILGGWEGEPVSEWLKSGEASKAIEIIGRRNLENMLSQMTDIADMKLLDV